VLGGIVGRAIKLDAFFNGIPVGKHARWNRRSRAPAVQGVLPLLLYREKRIGISRRY